MKIRPVRDELFHAGRQTDRRNEANCRFSQFYEGAWKRALREQDEFESEEHIKIVRKCGHSITTPDIFISSHWLLILSNNFLETPGQHLQLCSRDVKLTPRVAKENWTVSWKPTLSFVSLSTKIETWRHMLDSKRQNYWKSVELLLWPDGLTD